MSRRVLAVLAVLVTGFLTLVSPLIALLGGGMVPSAHTSATPGQATALQSGYGQLPLAFELNEGQAGAPARFVATRWR